MSKDEPKPGDIFLWRNGDDGHTGIVVSYDAKTGVVTTSEAKGTDDGSGQFDRPLTTFTNHKGWKGFFRPKTEHPDHDEKRIRQKSKKQEKRNLPD